MLSPITVEISVLFIVALIGYSLFSRLDKRKYYPIFLFCLLTVAVYLVSSTENEAPVEMSTEEKAQILREYPIFSEWYTNYKKDLDKIDLNWQQYHKLIKTFKNDEIGIETLHARLDELNKSTIEIKDKYAKLQPPENLTNANTALVAAIIEKTKEYVAAQDDTITKSTNATEAKNLTTTIHREQIKLLEKIMVMNSPSSLNISQEVLMIRDNLTIQNVQ